MRLVGSRAFKGLTLSCCGCYLGSRAAVYMATKCTVIEVRRTATLTRRINQESPTQIVCRSSLTRERKNKVSTRIWELAIVQDSLPWADGSDEMYSVDSGTPGVDRSTADVPSVRNNNLVFAASTDINY